MRVFEVISKHKFNVLVVKIYRPTRVNYVQRGIDELSFAVSVNPNMYTEAFKRKQVS